MNRSRMLNRNNANKGKAALAVMTVGVLMAWSGHSVRSARPIEGPAATRGSIEVGRSVFHREWLVNDPRSQEGDGLGPLFNESSCVACHNMGGAGGAGPVEKNVELLTAIVSDPAEGPVAIEGGNGLIALADAGSRELLAAIHPEFDHGDSVVLHRFGRDREAHESWQNQVRSGTILAQQQVFEEPGGVMFDSPPIESLEADQAQFLNQLVLTEQFGIVAGSAAVDSNQFPVISRVLQRIEALKQDVHPISSVSTATGAAVLQSSQRNTTPLFGIGLIDAIPDEAIEAAAERQHSRFPAVSGRIHRLEDGRIGRFGWKAQKASLYDFTMAACAVELGLHVPAHAQSEVPYDAEYEAPGLDLDQQQVDALVAYLRNLPPPVQNDPEDDEARDRIRRGEELFETAGCAACHVRQMGDVDRLYSDLLLHDLGGELGGVGHYGVQPGPSPESEALELSEAGEPQRPPGPGATEWRTPPLWGCRDSGPYLHDGRAKTVETAIAFHGAEAADSRLRFFLMPEEDQQLVIAFLKTLTAPDTAP